MIRSKVRLSSLVLVLITCSEHMHAIHSLNHIKIESILVDWWVALLIIDSSMDSIGELLL